MSILIGIPTLNGPARLTRCLTSIEATTDFVRFDAKVVIADDGSTDANLVANKAAVQTFATSTGTYELLHGHGRTGIAATWNRLVRHMPTVNIVVLINDDVEVVDHWLDVLAFSLEKNPLAGMIGLNTYCGVTKDQVSPQPRIDYAEACLMDGDGALVAAHGPIFGFRRDAWSKVGGFDEQYFCFYEEVDFGVSLRHQMYRHYMAAYPICFHMGGATNSDPVNLDAASQLRESRAKFEHKWGATLDELRRRFVAAHAAVPPPRVWNTQWRVWRDE